MLHHQCERQTGQRSKMDQHFRHLLFFWILFLLMHHAHGHFLVNSKAVMRDRLDHWTLRDGVRVPVLARMTVCVDVRVLTPGEWMAFSYTSRRWWSYDLALQGDDRALYVWFLGVRRRVRVHLSLLSWHRLCLQCDSLRDSFSLEVNGSIGATETTVMAGAMPAGGDLLLGWPPWEAPPGGRLAGVELYMFRMWGDVRPHAPCEDGTVAGWDSRLWSVSRPRAMARDDTLQCDMPNLLVHARIKRSNVSLGTGGTNNTSGLPVTANTTSAATVNGRAPSTSSSPPTPAAPETAAPTTTTPPPTASTPPFTPVLSTVTISDLTSSAPTSHSGANSRAVQPASSLLAQATGFLQAVASSALSTESAVMVKCDFSQFCDSTTSHYWMVVSVEVLPGNRKTVQDVQAWFSDVFSECGLSETPTPDAYSNETSGTSAAPGSCQNNSTGKSQIIKVDCEVKEDFTKTNCTVLVGRSQETDTCSISQLLQESRDHSLSAQLLGNVRRVGLDPCLDDLVLPPGDGFVHCNSSVPYQDVCVAEAPINITCSYQKSFLPQGLADGSVPSCNGQEQQYCHCDAFCQDPGAFYAFNLNIIKPDATFSDITNIITQLDSPCNSTIVPESLCNNISTVFNCYQGVHIQCYGNGTRLYNCMVALQLNQPVDTCTVSRALVPLLSPRSSVSYDGVLTRIALCGSRKISVADLFNSTFTWVRADLGAQQICQHSNFLDFREFTCGEGQVLSVLLNEICTAWPFPTGPDPNQTTPFNNSEPRTATPSQATVALVTSSPSEHSSSLRSDTFSPVVKPFNTTVTAPISREPPVSSTPVLYNTTVTLANITDTTGAPLGIPYTPLNISLNTTVLQIHSTELPNSTHALRELQLVSAPFTTPQPNVTQKNTTFFSLLTADFNKTTSELKTALFNTTPQNTLYINITTSLNSITELSMPTNTNATQFNYNATTLSQNISHSNLTVTHINRTLANSHLNTTLTNATFTTPTFTNATLTTPTFTNTTFANATLTNTTFTNTTVGPNATTFANTMQPKTTLTQFNTTMPFNNVTALNITIANTADANITTSAFYTTSPIRDETLNTTTNQLNVTDLNMTTEMNDSGNSTRNPTEPCTQTAQTNITQFNALEVTLNVTNPNMTSFTQNTTHENTTSLPLNITEFNTRFIPLNTTLINTTVSPNNTGPSSSNVTLNTTEFNTTTPVTTTTFINTTFPPTKSINLTSESFSTNYTGRALNTSQVQNCTSDKSLVQNITSNTTTENMTNSVNTTAQEGSLPFNMTSRPLTTRANTNNSTTAAVFNSTTSRSENQLGTSRKTQTNPQTTVANSTVPTTASTKAPSSGSRTVHSTATAASTIPATMTTLSLDLTVEKLLNESQNVKALNSSKVVQMVRDMEDLLSPPNISVSLARKILSIINNLLNCSTSILASSSNRLIKVVDTLGQKLVLQDTTETISLASVSLVVTKIDGTNFPGMSFSMTDNPNLVVKGKTRRSVLSSVPQAFVTLPASIIDNISPDTRPRASRVFFTFFQKGTLFNDINNSQQLNTPVVGASVSNLSITGLRDNVNITLTNREGVTGNLTCDFWDFGRNGGLGGWNTGGCFVVQNASTKNVTVCSCDHLTSFAVLMDISRNGITDRMQDVILTCITYIGCGISAIFLSITLLTYLSFDKIRRDTPSKLLINLCFALLLLNLVYLLDAWLALYPRAVGLCIATALFLHYFLLASFTWMGLEALHLYLAIVKVFNNSTPRYMLKFALIGWGIPLLVVIIVIAVNKDNYGPITYGKFSDNTTDDFCWLKNDIAFYVAVVAYFCVIFVSNLVTFVMVMVQLRRIKRKNPHNNQYRSGVQELRSVAGLTVLLGLTWGFAFFAWGPVNLAFMYLFCIFNSLQGFFIFVFHCAMKENVRKQWRTYLCCGRFRLAENSDWSRTHTKKTSLPTTSYTHHSQTQNSSSTASLTTGRSLSSVH